MNKKELEIKLSFIKDFLEKKPSLEQYTTPSALAADLLWTAYMNNDIQDKIILDAGCGNGILGIGALMLGAKKVIFVDIDKSAIKATNESITELRFKNFEVVNSNIFDYNEKAEVLITNPPFGVQKPGSDKDFLIKCSQLSDKIYLVYKGDGMKILQKLFPDKNIEIIKEDELILKQQFSFHTK
ncbi:MAG: methyltransferase, partial [Candidatus Nanoarchaeia archaeon]|nr:methyltransferase [Candidatus Nanoarchaeia archaeon]